MYRERDTEIFGLEGSVGSPSVELTYVELTYVDTGKGPLNLKRMLETSRLSARGYFAGLLRSMCCRLQFVGMYLGSNWNRGLIAKGWLMECRGSFWLQAVFLSESHVKAVRCSYVAYCTN